MLRKYFIFLEEVVIFILITLDIIEESIYMEKITEWVKRRPGKYYKDVIYEMI